MATEIISDEKGYGFSLTRFAGPQGREKMYHINEGSNFVQLDDWQMLQLVAAFIKFHNKEILRKDGA